MNSIIVGVVLGVLLRKLFFVWMKKQPAKIVPAKKKENNFWDGYVTFTVENTPTVDWSNRKLVDRTGN